MTKNMHHPSAGKLDKIQILAGLYAGFFQRGIQKSLIPIPQPNHNHLMTTTPAVPFVYEISF